MDKCLWLRISIRCILVHKTLPVAGLCGQNQKSCKHKLSFCHELELFSNFHQMDNPFYRRITTRIKILPLLLSQSY